MKKLGVLPKLTKKYLLDRIKQEEIAELYTKIPVNEDTLMGNSFTSPLRIDHSPTCNYYYNQNGKLRLKDWSGHFDGDVFDIVGYYEKINAKSPQGFQLIIHIIARKFAIHKYKDGAEREKLDNYILTYEEKQLPKLFKVSPRQWNRYDKRYWYDKFGIDSSLLRQAKIIPVEQLQIEDRDGYMIKKYDYRASDPAYAIYGGKRDGINIWKIYFPFRTNNKMSKFITNGVFLQGLHLLQPARVGIITKSYKDVLCMKTFGLQAVALAAESIILTKAEWEYLQPICDFWISVMDYDKAGILMSNKLKNTYGISPLMFTRGRFNQPDFGVKDFSEFRDVYGRAKTIQLIEQTIEPYREDLDKFSLEQYNNLKFIK
jgi:hypothetical protein